jgi:hypothetical protein
MNIFGNKGMEFLSVSAVVDDTFQMGCMRKGDFVGKLFVEFHW